MQAEGYELKAKSCFMKVTEKDVVYVADLANLELTDQERQRMVKDLDSILTYIARLNELDTSNVPPMTQVFTGTSATTPAFNKAPVNAWREDVPSPCLP